MSHVASRAPSTRQTERERWAESDCVQHRRRDVPLDGLLAAGVPASLRAQSFFWRSGRDLKWGSRSPAVVCADADPALESRSCTTT